MKKFTKRAAALLLTALMLFAMTACGGVNSSSGSVNTAHVGKYMLYEVKSGDTVLNGDTLKSLGMDTSYLELRADGTAAMLLIDEKNDNMTWGDGKIMADGESIDYKLSDGLLTISLDNEEMTFKKS